MNEYGIAFANKFSIGLLDLTTEKLIRLSDVNRDHEIFNRIQIPFDWFYQDEIMIIPDSVPTARINWSKDIYVNGQKIDCVGEFILFCHFDKIESMNFATSLSLPEFETIKNGIEII